MANQKTQDWNVCKNWGLRCYEQKVNEKSVTLKCTMNKKKEDGEYTKPAYIDVICILGKCDIAQDDYAKCFINVWGTFAVDEYISKATGEAVATLKIFADKVEKSVRK